MEESLAIKVDEVSKDFVLPHEQANSVKSLFTSFYKKKDKASETQHALRGIDFEVKEGEFFGIVGRNGSGKSTLLKILAGIYQPTKGTVHTRGKLVPFIELGVGFNPELTGRENVYLNGAMLGFSEKEVDAMYDGIVEFAELRRFMDQKLKNYSSGMQVRLAFSLATRAHADILLVDEVLAVGDADFQRKCFDYFRTLKKNKKTVIFVTHDMSAVREYCDRAMLIEKSKIVQIGSADEIATEYVKLFNDSSKSEAEERRDEGAKRWGDGSVELTSVKTKVTDKLVSIQMHAEIKEDIEDPIFGYLVKDSAGLELLGTNSKNKHIKLGELHKGEKVTLDWTLPNIFDDGKFTVTIAVTSNDGVTQADWWEDAVSFTVFRAVQTPYSLNPDVDLEVTKA